MIYSVRIRLLILLLCVFHSSTSAAKDLISPQCEPLIENTATAKEVKHPKGLLWKITGRNNETDYLFGTIHVSDPEVTALPDAVATALQQSDQFVMEALPNAEQMLIFSQMMFFKNGQRLPELIDKALYNQTKSILSAYHLGAEAVSVMKPWAAFLLMNYPPDPGEALDLVLLSLAQQNGATVAGLESLQEQAQIFSDLNMDEQLKLLTDTVCHYDVVEEDFIAMKAFYLKRDLGALYNHTQRFSMSKQPVYEKLMKKLIADRNQTMTERLQVLLDKGKSFIAIGALHLPGEEGVLALLEKQGYTITAVY